MQFDCDFQIGHDHSIIGCQDYCLVGECNGEAYAIVSDGCSASPGVDIGARILALAAKETILASHIPGMISDLSTYETFGKACIDRAATIYHQFPNFHPHGLDATLLVLRVKDNIANVYIYGDGIFLRKTENTLIARNVELTSGAPDYLSYKIDPARYAQYIRISDEKNGLKNVQLEGDYGGIVPYKPFEPINLSYEVKPGDILSIGSDGIGSFRKSDDTPISFMDIANEFTAYKNTTGVFVKRRLNAFKKKCLKEGITHSDDISIASIVV